MRPFAQGGETVAGRSAMGVAGVPRQKECAHSCLLSTLVGKQPLLGRYRNHFLSQSPQYQAAGSLIWFHTHAFVGPGIFFSPVTAARHLSRRLAVGFWGRERAKGKGQRVSRQAMSRSCIIAVHCDVIRVVCQAIFGYPSLFPSYCCCPVNWSRVLFRW